MKRMLLLASSILLSSAFIAPTALADSCTTPGVRCLFSDGSGCGITCGFGECAKCVTAGCILGFGYDAECECRPCPTVRPPVIIVLPKGHAAGH